MIETVKPNMIEKCKMKGGFKNEDGKIVDTKLKQCNIDCKNSTNLSSLFSKDVKISIGDGIIESDVGIVSLHPTEGTLWPAYIS